MQQVTEFSGKYRWLSNFWAAKIVINGWEFLTNEHAYQAAKSLDPNEWTMIQGIYAPGRVKQYGRQLKLRSDWEDIKLEVMREITALKYDQHPALKAQLLATRGMELIEGNRWGDTFWGVCRGVGQNHLGRILMEYRDAQTHH